MNDEMKMLRAAGTDLDPPGGTPTALRERVIAGFIADGGAVGALNPGVASDVIRMHRPWGRRVALVGGVAAALTGALVLGPTVGGSGGGEQPGLGIDAAAAAVLQDAAAVEAKQEPWVPRPDQFIYTKYVATGYVMQEVDGKGVEVVETSHVESWSSVDGLHTGLSTGRTEPSELTPDGRRNSQPLPPCAEGSESWCMNRQAYPADLPTDGNVDVMLQYLRDNAEPRPEPYPADWPAEIPDSGTFYRAQELLALGSLPPQARSAVFGAIAKVPGVTVTGDAVDAAGRPGVAVGFTYAQGTRDELIFDEGTNEFLGYRNLWTPEDLARGVPATNNGASYEMALLKSGVVDRVREKP
ncbi:CU044_5270 family protein [Promicromonospora sukumoe]|uniref:CU044_5270 family protein n=1 Tax=Promicromonospora sukumoe TaxID=88382 RepID=UPI0037C77F95